MPNEEYRRRLEGSIYATTTYVAMVFTATQITAFFTESTQMEISACTRQSLEDEVISKVADLHEWEDDEWY